MSSVCVSQQSAFDASNFDMDFTMEPAVVTPVDKELAMSIDQDQFHGFSYVSSEFGNLKL